MSRRRRRVKIKSSSRLFAFILSFNLLLLASCVTAHYQQRPQLDELEVHQASSLPQQQQQALLLESSLINSQTSYNQNLNHFQQNQKQATGSNAQLQSSQQQQLQAHQPLLADDSLGQPNSNNQNQHHQQANRDNADPTAPFATTATTPIPSIAGLCLALPFATARQLRLCRFVSHSSNADEAVAVGAARGLAECRQQFRSERWNCTHAGGDHHLLTSKLTQSVGNREGSFVQAIVAAGIVHSIATACSIGSLNDCACDKSRVGPIRQRDQNWKWGGCSNNIRHGMMYARHLVELLDAVHEHHHHQMQRSLGPAGERPPPAHNHHHRPTRGHHQHYHNHHHLKRRSLVAMTPNPRTVQQDQQQAANICQKNQNISQTIHIQLIKSLLAKNSLERHQDFRLAMNAHNNKVGRMAVAKNMEIKCRCHGLSGSCSLKTCWLKLPDFQQIGAHLKRKYEGSIHLPTAINVNKLIPMMDRDEISAILLQQQQQHQVAAVGPLVSEPTVTESSNSLRSAVLAGTSPSTTASQPIGQPLQVPEFAAWSSEAAPTPPARLNYYERHKQLEQKLTTTNNTSNKQSGSWSTGSNSNKLSTNTTSLYLHGDEVPVQIVPMSQQQYQTLLRDMKLCNSSQVAPTIATRSHLITRDLHNQFDQQQQTSQRHLKQQQQTLGRKSQVGANSLAAPIAGNNNEIGAGRLPSVSSGSSMLHAASHGRSQSATATDGNQHQQHQQQLSHLLQWNNRDELVHLHKSPDYCEPDLRHGFAGVQARLCSNDPQAPDSCDRLCCGRGFERREIELRYNCDCKFQYCCKIHCNVCQKTLVEYVCK